MLQHGHEQRHAQKQYIHTARLSQNGTHSDHQCYIHVHYRRTMRKIELHVVLETSIGVPGTRNQYFVTQSQAADVRFRLCEVHPIIP